MPRKSKLKRRVENSLSHARDAKRSCTEVGESSRGTDQLQRSRSSSASRPERLEELLELSDEALDTDNEEIDPSFDLDTSLRSDTDHMVETFCEDWVTSLRWEDRASLGLFLCFQLSNITGKGETEAAELAGQMIGKSDRTIREWRTRFFDNDGKLSENKEGQYERRGVLWRNEALNRKATKFIRANAAVKGKPNLTAGMFCQWVNDELLPNETLEPGFPRTIQVETARAWMHELGFQVLKHKKGSFVDGHERADVVEYRRKFLRRMVALGFLNTNNAPTVEAKEALPTDLSCPPQDVLDKTVVLFHDESTFQSNEDQATFWGTKGTHVLKPKGRGVGIMVSDFIDEHNGYLALTQEEYDQAKLANPQIWMHARVLLEYGEGKEGYWTSDRFIDQLKKAVEIAEVKYPPQNGWKIVWIFDHSSCHGAMAEDSLDVSKMNVKPGGKQRVMRDGWWNGKPQKMNYSLGVPKGLRVVLEERGVNTRSMSADEMRETLASHPDFKNEKSRVERFLMEEKRHIVYMLPKYHPELNPIERVWAQAKRYTKAYCKYTLPSLRANIHPALESVPLESIQKHYMKVRHYMFAYLEGVKSGSELEDMVKNYKKKILAHRRISEKQ